MGKLIEEYWIFAGNGCEICQSRAGRYPEPFRAHENCNCELRHVEITEECQVEEERREKVLIETQWEDLGPGPQPNSRIVRPLGVFEVTIAKLWRCCKYENNAPTDDCFEQWDYTVDYDIEPTGEPRIEIEV